MNDCITQWEAEDAACDDLLATPAVVAEYLANHCQRHAEPVSWDVEDIYAADVPQLLAAVLTSATEAQTMNAVVALRDAFRTDMRNAIQQRARAIFNARNGVAA